MAQRPLIDEAFGMQLHPSWAAPGFEGPVRGEIHEGDCPLRYGQHSVFRMPPECRAAPHCSPQAAGRVQAFCWRGNKSKRKVRKVDEQWALEAGVHHPTHQQWLLASQLTGGETEASRVT